jgi:hypothetical protein
MNKEEIISSLINAKICEASEIRGASLEDVATLERAAGRKLPAQYREFLLGVGRRAGRFLEGKDIFVSALDGLKEEADSLMQENEEGVVLTKEDFVFSMHQGYEFTYFKLSEGDDPPVYQYVEGNGSPVLTWNSFSDFLRDSLNQYATNESGK